MANKVTGKKWYTNGETEIQLRPGETAPEGFVLGRLRAVKDKISATRLASDLPPWNKGIPASEECKRKQSESMRGKPAWNKGLTKETNESVASASEKLKGHVCFVTDWATARLKEYETKRLHNSFCTSKPEQELYEQLVSIYGKADVKRQYMDERYPFRCDFYVCSQDLFIELNYTWEHGSHPYDEANPNDQTLVAKWYEKSDFGKLPNRYRGAIRVYTQTDPLKLKTFRDNHLNFQIIYPDDLIIDN